jgi:hypothetical protein
MRSEGRLREVTREMRAEYDRRYRVRLNIQHAIDSAIARQAVKDAERRLCCVRISS